MRNLLYKVIAAIFIVSPATACQVPQSFSNADSDELFDTPIRTETVDLVASPYYSDGENSPPTALSCYYFTSFMVKQHDLGGRGAEWLSILTHPGETPECKSSHEAGERIIEYPEWEGYFMGVKGRLVFFHGSDTVNGGWPFAVYESTNGKKIFEDFAYDERASSSGLVQVVSTSAGYLLKYVRVVTAACNLNSEGATCWSQIESEYALRSDAMPPCTGYDHIADLVGTDQVESVIAYAVEVSLAPLPFIHSAAGATRCWASH